MRTTLGISLCTSRASRGFPHLHLIPHPPSLFPHGTGVFDRFVTACASFCTFGPSHELFASPSSCDASFVSVSWRAVDAERLQTSAEDAAQVALQQVHRFRDSHVSLYVDGQRPKPTPHRSQTLA